MALRAIVAIGDGRYLDNGCKRVTPALSYRAERMVERIQTTRRRMQHAMGLPCRVGSLVPTNPEAWARKQHADALRALRRFIREAGGYAPALTALIREVESAALDTLPPKGQHTAPAKELRRALMALEGRQTAQPSNHSES